MDHSNTKIASSVFGVLGGSYAEALHYAGYEHIIGVDIDETSIETAKSLWVIEKDLMIRRFSRTATL